MADEKEDVKTEASESSTEADQTKTVTPPAEESSATEKESEQRVPYARFHEVNERMKLERSLREQYEGKLRTMESSQSQARPNYADAEVKRLVEKLGMDEKAAREIVVTQQNISRAENASVEEKLKAYEVQSWIGNLASQDPDYKSIAPEMDKAFSEMTPDEKKAVLSSSRTLRMFYNDVKAIHGQDLVKKAREDGASEAYKTRQAKEAVSSGGGKGSADKGQLTVAAIAAMDIKTYKERLPEINAALASGKLR